MFYSEFRFWSVTHDQEMVRLSMSDAHNREFYMTIPAEGHFRERRDAALEAIGEAINAGLQPGRVVTG